MGSSSTYTEIEIPEGPRWGFRLRKFSVLAVARSAIVLVAEMLYLLEKS